MEAKQKCKCSYPTEHGCKLEGKYKQSFEIINEQEAHVDLLFCQYHHLIVVGGHFKAKIIKASQNLLGEKKAFNFELIGPLNEVEIAEQVMGAREMMKEFKSDNK